MIHRTLQTASFEVPTLTKNTKVSEISTPAKIVTAVSPIPSKICVTSPKGDRKKSIWEMELPKIDVEHVPSRRYALFLQGNGTAFFTTCGFLNGQDLVP